MSSDLALSRPLLLATQLTGASQDEARSRLLNATIHLRIAPEFADSNDAALLLRSLADQLSRFCGTVVVSGPAGTAQACLDRDSQLHDPPRVHAGGPQRTGAADLDILVGDRPESPGEMATCSDGWTGRVSATSTSDPMTAFVIANPVGALTAAALAAGEAFLRLIGVIRPPRAFELSAWTGQCGLPGSVPHGPQLPAIAPIDALLIGCGNVMNGWAVAARALQITGQARAVDRQVLGEENLGPYALARRDMAGQPKTALLAAHLHPRIAVSRHDEELDLFVPKITRWHLPLPALVINGLDEVEPRYTVQRLWPDVLVDMAAGGTTSQVIVHRRDGAGQCLLGAFAMPDAELGYVRRIETVTGLRRERFINDCTTPITNEDVAKAPPEHRARLRAAADSGQLLCGYINQASLTANSSGEDFAPAAPFVGALTGARAAAITVALLSGNNVPGGLRWQYNFLSNRARTAVMHCAATCECQTERAS